MLTPPFLVHFSGPLHEPRNLLHRYVRKSIRAPQSLGFRRVLLAESKHKPARNNTRPSATRIDAYADLQEAHSKAQIERSACSAQGLAAHRGVLGTAGLGGSTLGQDRNAGHAPGTTRIGFTRRTE